MINTLCRYGEIGLKGKNRPFFETRLVENIRKILPLESKVKKIMGRILITGEVDFSKLKKVFGLVSFSPIKILELDEDTLKGILIDVANQSTAKTFRISVNRSNKHYPKTSPILEAELGEYVLNNTNLTVSIKNYDLNLQVEVGNDSFFVYTDAIQCCGGLPIGCADTVTCLIDNDNSNTAAILMMRRGCNIIPISFTPKDISILKTYGCTKSLKIIKDLNEVETTVLVVGDLFEEIKEYKTSAIVLRPVLFGSPITFENENI